MKLSDRKGEKMLKENTGPASDPMAIVRGQKLLKKGYTTGSTAAAASRYSLMKIAENLEGLRIEKAFKEIVLEDKENQRVTRYIAEVCRIKTPSAVVVDVELGDWEVKSPLRARTTCIKDSGDDPDVTHRARISSELFIEPIRKNLPKVRDYVYAVSLENFQWQALNTFESNGDYQRDLAKYEQNYFFIAIGPGEGVGRVTKKGLAPNPNHGAINPVPREMIVENIIDIVRESPPLAQRLLGQCVRALISVENGEKIAQKTFNPKLGILGGISILGTSGIVEPMSEKALVDTIKTEVDQFVALETSRPLLICPGNYGQDYIKEALLIDISQSVKVSNYIGDALDYIVYLGIKEVLFVGHAGKLIKLAASVMNTHSSYADGRAEIITSHGAISGASRESLVKIMNAISVDEMLEALLTNGERVFKDTMDSIKTAIRRNLDHRTRKAAKIEFIVFTNEYGMIIESEDARTFAKKVQEEA